jgi:hypothetical protein
MVISSRTPEGEPGHCPICSASVRVESSPETRDAPCPCCGHLLWFRRPQSVNTAEQAQLIAEEVRLGIDRLIQVGTSRFGPPNRGTAIVLCAIRKATSLSELERHLPRARTWDEIFSLTWESQVGG